MVVGCALTSGCLGRRTIDAVTIEVDNSAGVYKIGTDVLDSTFAKHFSEQLAANHRQAMVVPIGGETIFIKLLSDTVTPAPSRILGDGQKHTVLCSYTFRTMSGTMQSELTVRPSSFFGRVSTSLTSLISDPKAKEIWPELDDIITDLSTTLYYNLY